MVRSELLQKMCNLHPNIIRRDMEKILEIIFFEIMGALCEGKNIEIRGFGTYKIVKIQNWSRTIKCFSKVFFPTNYNELKQIINSNSS